MTPLNGQRAHDARNPSWPDKGAEMLPTWYLTPAGLAAVRQRAAELRTFLLIRRAMRGVR